MRKICILAAVVASALAAAPSQASFWLTPTFSTTSAADFDDFDGDVSSTSYGLMGGNEYFTLGYKGTSYDFSGPKLFDDMSLLFADLHFKDNLSAQWGYFAGVGVAFGWEDDFDATENYNFKPRAGLSYAINGDYRISGGIGANINEPDSKVYPIITLNYRNSSDYGLSYVFGFPMIDAQYRFNDLFALNGKVTAVPVNQDIYQLSDDSSVARKGYLAEESAEANIGVTITPMQAFSITAGVGVKFAHEYKIYNKYGDEIRSYETDPSGQAYIGFNAHF